MYDYTREMNIEGERQEEYDGNRVTLYERWASREALDLHSAMSYMDEFGAKVTIRTGVNIF